MASFTEAVAQRTDNKFNIRLAVVGELGIGRDDIPLALEGGIIEMAYMLTATLTTILPQAAIFDLPYLAHTNEEVLKLNEALYEDVVADMKPLGFQPVSKGAFWMWALQNLICTSPIKDFTDLAGYKIRVWRTLDGELMAAMGGTPVYMAGPECYMGMQRGVIDAVNTSVAGIVDRSLHEVGKYYYPLGLAPGGCYLVVNNDAWAALPDEYKQILREEADKAVQWYLATFDSELEVYHAAMVEEGVQYMDIPPEGTAAWLEKAAPIWDEWAKDDPRSQAYLEKAIKAFGL